MTAGRCGWLALVAVLCCPGLAAAQDAPATLEDLLKSVRADSQQRSKDNQAREQRFVQARDQQQA
ncbi:MAG: MotA/TolQ/ExbB proton channel family protein, partial [Gammaproteobacteria bacterium]|nr:MotA/TolQ/ExbB proton channel family protein [Gammaproteobacteria bacterium]